MPASLLVKKELRNYLWTRADTKNHGWTARRCTTVAQESDTCNSLLMAYARQLPSGRWQGGYRDHAGNQRSAGTFAKEQEAIAAAVAKELEQQAPASNILWGEWEKRWTRKVAPSTIAADASRLEQYIRPRWSDVPLSKIRHQDVQQWIDGIQGQSASSVRKIGAVFSASLRDAKRAGLLEYNPADDVRYEKLPASPERWLTREETDALREAIPAGDSREFFDFLLGTGMRFGEAAGTHWDQIDLEAGSLVVKWSADRGRGFKSPKSGKFRHVPLGKSLVETLRARLERNGLGEPVGEFHGGNKPMYGLVFASERGGPVNNRRFGALVTAAALVTKVGGRSLGEVRVHDLRHSYATQLVRAGVPLDEVQRLLGHSTIAMTQRYADAGQSRWGDVRAVLG